MAVVFAMMTSYLLSRTLVPTMAQFLLRQEVSMYGGTPDAEDVDSNPARKNGPMTSLRRSFSRTGVKISLLLGASLIAVVAYAIEHKYHIFGNGSLTSGLRTAWNRAVADPQITFAWFAAMAAAATLLLLIVRYALVWRVHFAFNRQFERFRRFYGGLLYWTLEHRAIASVMFLLFVVGSAVTLAPIVGQDFFPTVDAGQIRLHVRAPAGTRIEETENYFAKIEGAIRELIPARDLDAMLDNIGIPNSGINLSLSDGTLCSPADGEFLISLNPDHAPTRGYIRTLRAELPKRFPELSFVFQPADIVTQVLNFGLSSPINVQVAGPLRNDAENCAIATQIMSELRGEPGLADVHMHQVRSVPDLRVAVDRTFAGEIGLTQRDVAQDLLISLSGTLQAAPNFWMNPQNGVTYSVIVQTPQYRIDSLSALQTLPIHTPPTVDGASTGRQLLANLADTTRGVSSANISHYNILRSVDVQMNVDGADLGSAGERVRAVVDKYRSRLPRGSTIALRGQIESMRTSFLALAGGLVFAILLVYLLMVINFQSWIDPFIILMALPGAAAGILWMLFVTGTTVSVPALMGAIMAIGVATANSILMVTFANDRRRERGGTPKQAALAAGMTRLRPVIMTALAMIIGMLPMSLGLGEGGEQNAPLARAVIGGLLMATVTTLFFVPICYSALRHRSPHRHLAPELLIASDHPELHAAVRPKEGLAAHG
ncbi:MAG: efflux RND transporter permease subunit [Planctomycetes bacterium]|nr:efflux RND transporter permease subunit [Planctomycetota bacterium]